MGLQRVDDPSKGIILATTHLFWHPRFVFHISRKRMSLTPLNVDSLPNVHLISLLWVPKYVFIMTSSEFQKFDLCFEKVVKLQMSPPNLTFTRELRTSAEVVIRFTPRATNTEVVHLQGHVYLLSDLFLVCERMSPEDQAHPGNEGADMWLCYPPLAGKVLRVSEVPGQGLF